MKVYEFVYCDCIYESADYTMSTHRTIKGAYKAMNNYLQIKYADWYNERILYGKDRRFDYKFGAHESWRVKSKELLD